VIITRQKESELGRVFEAYPARHYVVIDDKPSILAAIEQDCPTSFTTILVMQGKYAGSENYAPRPDITVSHIADLMTMSPRDFGG
jgi:hypothetical protein